MTRDEFVNGLRRMADEVEKIDAKGWDSKSRYRTLHGAIEQIQLLDEAGVSRASKGAYASKVRIETDDNVVFRKSGAKDIVFNRADMVRRVNERWQ